MSQVVSKILVVEDDPVIAKLMRFILEAEGYSVETLWDGIRAVEKIKQTLPNLVIMDVMVYGMDGYDVCRIIKNNPETRNIPVMIVSAKGQRREQEMGFEAGASAYLVKPFEPQDFLELVRRLLKKSEEGEPRLKN